MTLGMQSQPPPNDLDLLCHGLKLFHATIFKLWLIQMLKRHGKEISKKNSLPFPPPIV